MTGEHGIPAAGRIIASPARFRLHDEPQGMAVMWLQVYAASTSGVGAGVQATIRLGENNGLQPYGFLFRVDPPGNARITEHDYIEGAPELIVEVAASSASYDLHDTLEAYRRAGVQEYIVWEVIEGRIRWFRLRGDRYEQAEPDENAIIESEVFPGLRLDVPAMLAGDRVAVLAALRPAPRRRSRRA